MDSLQKVVSATISTNNGVSSSPSLATSSGSSGSPLKDSVVFPSVNNESNSNIINSKDFAAFSLASLDQGNSRGSLSCMNLQFDTAVFLKSGSFESLLGSAIFNGQLDMKNIPNLPLPMVNVQNNSMATSNPANNNNTSSQNILTNSSSPPHNNQNVQNNLVSSNQQLNNQIGLNGVSALKSILPATPIPSSVIATSVPNLPVNAITNPSQHTYMPYGNNALIQPKENEKRIVERKDENSKFVDVTPFLTLPQHEAAKKLGIPSSTLAKRWKEASCNRKWPYRTVSKLDKEILTLLKNVENAKAELSPSVEATLGLLLKKRQEELKTVLVRL